LATSLLNIAHQGYNTLVNVQGRP